MDLPSLRARYERISTVFPLVSLQERLLLLREASTASTLWDDQASAVAVLSELSDTESLVSTLTFLGDMLNETELSEEDAAELESEVMQLERRALLSGEHDTAGALISIHAGTGGVDAQDWAEMLLRQYLRFVEKGATESAASRPLGIDRSKWKAELLESTAAEEAGIKQATIEVSGRYAYGLLKGEGGVHRLVRLSPFNAKNLRQTSFALLEVLPVLGEAEGTVIKEEELRIDVFRAGGHGGQGVNTTDSAVRITHLPTGIVVSVQNERSQHQNKATALKILQGKLAKLDELRAEEERAMLRGELKEGSWGNQIRSYVLQPYQLVKDHRTDTETTDVQAVLGGEIGPFVESILAHSASNS